MPLTSAFKGGNCKDSDLEDKRKDLQSGSDMGIVKKDQLSSVDENTLAKVLANDKSNGIGSDSFEDQNGNKEKMLSKSGADTFYALLSKDDENADGQNSFPNDHDTQHKVNHDNVIDSVKHENAQQDAPVIEEEVVGKRDNGNMQEFVKMFSHEEQSKPTRRRESNTLKLKKNRSQQTKLEEGSSKKSVEHNDVKVNPMPEQPEQLHFGNKGSISETFDTSVECIEVENMIEDHPEQTSINQQESIQILDAKIKKWSNGKKENLRALLSTLQYVLWPESGWTPVPLVDIIESASVKRAYQKTMLY